MFIVHCSYTTDMSVYEGSVHVTREEADKAAFELANSMLISDDDSVEKTTEGYVAHFYNVAQDYEDDVTVYIVEGSTFFAET